MSGRLVSDVFASTLPAWLKPYAAALASFAAADGSQIFPSVGRLARMVGKSERSAQRALKALRAGGVLERAGACRYRSRAYRLCVDAIREPEQLPLFPQPKPLRAGDRSELSTDFHNRNRTPVSLSPDTGVTRSVSDPSFLVLINARAREQANAQKQGGR